MLLLCELSWLMLKFLIILILIVMSRILNQNSDSWPAVAARIAVATADSASTPSVGRHFSVIG